MQNISQNRDNFLSSHPVCLSLVVKLSCFKLVLNCFFFCWLKLVQKFLSCFFTRVNFWNLDRPTSICFTFPVIYNNLFVQSWRRFYAIFKNLLQLFIYFNPRALFRFRLIWSCSIGALKTPMFFFVVIWLIFGTRNWNNSRFRSYFFGGVMSSFLNPSPLLSHRSFHKHTNQVLWHWWCRCLDATYLFAVFFDSLKKGRFKV